MIYIDGASDGYFFGDCLSNSGGTGVDTKYLTGATKLSYNKWYTIKIDVTINGDDGFKAVWYVDGVKTSESTNFAIYGWKALYDSGMSKDEIKASEAPKNTISAFNISALKSATLDMMLDNMSIKAVKYAQVDKEPVVNEHHDFDSATDKVFTPSKSYITSEIVTPESEIDSVVKITKTAGSYTTATYLLDKNTKNAKYISLSFDIYIPKSENGYIGLVYQIILDNANSPYRMAIQLGENDFSLGDREYDSGASNLFISGLSYDKWYNVRIDIEISGDSIEANWNVSQDGNSVKTAISNVFNKEKTTAAVPITAPMTSVTRLVLCGLSTSYSVIYLDDLSVTVYE